MHIFTDRFGDKHLPVFDTDSDRFSGMPTFRGYNWRGKDCNDLAGDVYPGRKRAGHHSLDHDCNGIFGLSPEGKPYEEKFCEGSIHLGVGVVGDSAGAHFSIPAKFMDASLMGNGTFKDLLTRLANEFDVPHESGYTGYSSQPQTHSVYKYLRSHNLCINNDYQNLGVNGGSSSNSETNFAALAREQGKDHPMLLFFELIGNDVCGSGLSTITKDRFKKNILKLWTQLDERLPKGSHLWVFGLVDGRLLYDNLYDQLHPLNVTYPVVYDFLNCLKISPCFGFLNSNQSARDYTAALAEVLNQGYRELLQENHSFANFDIAYYDFPAQDIMQRYAAQGKNIKDLIEPCDGFHPSGAFHSELADWIWERLRADHPDWIGPPNPHNPQIKQVFKLDDLS